MAVHYRTRGFFIKETDRGENNRLFTIYTEDFGKLAIFSKAVRKIKSKLRCGAGLFYLSEIEFIRGKNRKTLTDAILIEKFPNIRKDLKRLSLARQITEVLDNLVLKEEKDGQIWELLCEIFQKLDSWKLSSSGRYSAEIEILYHYFLWNFVSILGYKPEFHDCAIDETKINCDIVKILKVILRKDWLILSRLKIEPFHRKLLKNASEWYIKRIIT